MKINEDGINLIKQFEGLRLNSYFDSVGVCTVGYGHTQGAYGGQVITKEQADELLRKDLDIFEFCVSSLLTRQITENQFSALVCFAFNVGVAALKRSTLLECVNKGDFAEAADQFLKWDKAGGRALTGLERRREAERRLFLKDGIEDDVNRNIFGSGAV